MMVQQPPTQLWFRGGGAFGALRVALLFKSVVVVATGSGIGPCLGLFKAHPEHPVRALWSARDPEGKYGQETMSIVKRADSKANIYDTDGHEHLTPEGILERTKALYTGDDHQNRQAEAVVVVSNQKLTYRLVLDLEKAGIPAYLGPIWDS
ncbi:hypothetical protein BU16DRAFT_26198 [Lophium mytilinum]|uniref:Uncharacterized protein n=1 Tax=Lophium mytilinum TaxID=390894 RepID=A0A6A6RHQ8_9PEZI|nr:hypothetical protein BU16DRAFT_26198 [Lophium mytilinum]